MGLLSHVPVSVCFRRSHWGAGRGDPQSWWTMSCAGGGMPELTSPPSPMLTCSVTPNGSTPTVLTPCHPHLTLSCRAPCCKCGQVLQKKVKVQAACISAEPEEANNWALRAHTLRGLQPKDALEHFFGFLSSPKQANTILPMLCGVRCSHTCWKITIC